MKNFLSFALIAMVLSGCFGGLRPPADEKSKDNSQLQDIPVEAYLFDVKLRRKGKPTSVRLDLYQTDSVVAMYGRGYFNKGAFWGRLTNDSMLVFFPSTKEYLDETIENLFLSFDCETELIGLNLLSYFISAPDSGHISDNLVVKTLEEENNSIKKTIQSLNCPWILSIGYSNEEQGWRIDSFEFDDAKEVTIKGIRRRYKADATVSSSQFKIQIPANAVKITL